MRIAFEVSDDEARRAREFFEQHKENPFVRRRKARNVDHSRTPVTPEEFWEALASALLTTQQRSGPASAISRFVRTEPFPLALSVCKSNQPCGDFVESTITQFGGIRRSRIISKELQDNLTWLDQEGWASILPRLASLSAGGIAADERACARYLADNLKGLGPKQARNVLQMLGLTRYETPLDSRISRWLNDFGFPLHLTATGLSDHAYYELVSDGFQVLCERAGVLPCLMDAAIFVSFDGNAWNGEDVTRW